MTISPVPRKLLSDEVFEQLKAAIVSSDLQPGEKIRDSELAQRLGLSRTPVREAINRLVDTGLVEAKPGAYTRVSPISRIEVRRTLSVLRSLDALAVETAVPSMTTADVADMRAKNDLFATAVIAEDVTAALNADDAFHGIPLAIADNPTLERIVRQLHPQIHRILHRKFSTLMGRENTVHHHKRFIELCESGDARGAAALSGNHWLQLGELIDELFETDQLS